MGAFMVVATFREGTDMAEVFAVVEEEQAQARKLADEGKVGSISIARERGTVFIETFADTIEAASEVVRTLPMARWWDLDVFELVAPGTPQDAS